MGIFEKHLRLDLTTVSGSPLAGQVGQRAMARSLELTVRHGDLRLSTVAVVVGSEGGMGDGGSKEEEEFRR